MLPGSLRLVAQHHVSRPNLTTFLLSSSLSSFFPQKHLCHPWRGYKTLPHLMDFPLTVKPKLSHTIRNSFLSRLLITPYFDPDFSMAEFKEGAKQAAVLIANSLAEGDLDQVAAVVTPECLNMLQKNISKEERESLRISLENIQINFIYQIGIMMEDDPVEENKHTRHVEITWVAHALSKEQEEAVTEHSMEVLRPNETFDKMKEVLDETGGSTILNYRFIREYTKGVEDTWTVNAVNHFKLMDLERET